MDGQQPETRLSPKERMKRWHASLLRKAKEQQERDRILRDWEKDLAVRSHELALGFRGVNDLRVKLVKLQAVDATNRSLMRKIRLLEGKLRARGGRP